MPQTLPFFTSNDYPKELTSYRVPLQRGSRKKSTVVLFSVDWEKDHGRWRSGPNASYRGIHNATRPLCDILDRLNVPCTWFVEANSSFPELDMIRSTPEELSFLNARERDEIGLHLHWGNFYGTGSEPRSLHALDEWRQEVTRSTQSLSNFIQKPVASFRSGGHTLIPGLPGVLQELGYRADLSVEDRRRPALRRLQGLFGFVTGPFHPDTRMANRQGGLKLWEIPTSLHLHDFERLEHQIQRFLCRGRQRVLSIYIHIDELTVPQTEELALDRLLGVEKILSRLQNLPSVEFHSTSSYLDSLKA